MFIKKTILGLLSFVTTDWSVKKRFNNIETVSVKVGNKHTELLAYTRPHGYAMVMKVQCSGQ